MRFIKQAKPPSGESALNAGTLDGQTTVVRWGQRIPASIWVQACYWWYFAGVASLFTYISLYYRQLGFSGPQIGALMALIPLGSAVLAPVWGTWADTYSAHRALLRTAFCLAAITALLLTRVTAFPAFLALVAVLAVALAAIPALLDGYAVTISAQEGRAFGQLRVWGSLGFIAAAWLIGRLMGPQVSKTFLFSYAIFLMLAGLSTLALPSLGPSSSRAPWQGARRVLRKRSLVLFLLTAYCMTSSAAVLNGFLGLYLVEIGGKASMVGTALAVGAISELPVLLWSRPLLRRLASRHLLVLSIVFYILRFGLYSLPPSPSMVVVLQMLHGLSFGMYLIGSITLAHELAGQAGAATAQGLLAAVGGGLGSITGALLGGNLIDHVGGVGLFRMATIGMGISLLCWLTLGLPAVKASLIQEAK